MKKTTEKPPQKKSLTISAFEWQALTKLDRFIVLGLARCGRALNPNELLYAVLDEYFRSEGIQTNIVNSHWTDVDELRGKAEDEVIKKYGGISDYLDTPVYRTVRREADALNGWVLSRPSQGKAKNVYYLPSAILEQVKSHLSSEKKNSK